MKSTTFVLLILICVGFVSSKHSPKHKDDNKTKTIKSPKPKKSAKSSKIPKLSKFEELCNDNNGHLSNSKLCHVPVVDVYINYQAAEKYCIDIGGKIASIRKFEPSLLEFIRDRMWPSYLTSLWVDGIVQEDNKVLLKSKEVVDFGANWRKLYPMNSIYRTHIVYDVWRSNTPDLKALRGFRNVPSRLNTAVLCELKK